MPEDLPQLERAARDVFFAAVEIESETRRRAFLDDACAGHPGLRERVETLLANDRPDDFLEQGAVPLSPTCPGDLTVTVSEEATGKPAEDARGRVLGRYKLLEKVGEGGCGVVYVAEQTEPVRRRVALKVIKRGMDTRSVIARFEAERQALAMMDHPNIAKVLDAGATDRGRPFFVMELVRGIPITEYCDQNQLPTPERLELFIKVCRAVQHAHQKGIIHRDLKPSNILVTLHDGVPVPKVIDFGIAKATEGRLTDATVYTHLHQFIGTPAYMSPEQAEMSGLDIDTRSDIYSLGVLLYELLAGRPPFDPRELVAQGLDAMRRTIREVEPVRPSTRLATLQGEERTTTARRRSADAAALVHLLEGDLDWIVMKCLEKDRTRRYETSNGLAADLRRFLDDEPVTARPPSAAYRLHKAWRRHRLVFAAGAAVTVALVTGLLAASLQAVRARRAEAQATARATEAEQARAEAEQVAQFLQQVFGSPDPARDGRTITVAEGLDRAAQKLSRDLAGQPARRARLQATLARTYFSLGLYESALRLWEAVRDHWRAAGGPDHPETLLASAGYAQALYFNGQPGLALPLLEGLREPMQRRFGPDDTNTLDLAIDHANVLQMLGRMSDALPLMEENLAAWRRAFGPEHPKAMTALQNLEVICYDLGLRERAAALESESIELTLRVLGPEHPATLDRLSNQGITWRDAGRLADALQRFEENLEKKRRVLGPTHPATLHTTRLLMDCYGTSGRTNQMLRLVQETLDLCLKHLGPDHPQVTSFRTELANKLAAQGRWREVQAELQQVSGVKTLSDEAHWALMCLAVLEVHLGERDAYEVRRSQMLERFKDTQSAALANRVAKSALLLPLEGGRLAEAQTLAERSLTLTNESPNLLHWRLSAAALARYRAGHWASAAEAATRAVDLAREQAIPANVAISNLLLAMTRHQLGQAQEARAELDEAAALIATKWPELELGVNEEWQDILIAHILLREARETLSPGAPGKSAR